MSDRYRPNAGVMLLNRARRVFVAQRLDGGSDAWQMPQGGLDPGEDPQAGALRELEEETGIPPAKVAVLARASRELFYDVPESISRDHWGGRWTGQRQWWFVARFLGEDADIDLATDHPEFRAWRWADAHELPDLVVPFKRALYEAVLAEFGAYLAPAAA